MRRLLSIAFPLFLFPLVAAAQDLRSGAWPEDDVIFEVIGQVKNAGTASVQYGYLPYINGLTLDQTFAPGGPQDERSALFTFYNEGTTLYQNLGLDPTKVTIKDPAGRPQYLTEMQPIRELI